MMHLMDHLDCSNTKELSTEFWISTLKYVCKYPFKSQQLFPGEYMLLTVGKPDFGNW